MREKIFIKAIICSIWNKTDFIPLNLELILGKMRETQKLRSLHSITLSLALIFNTILD